MKIEDHILGFEYEVFCTVVLNKEQAKLLKDLSKSHYDYKCREAGESGCVNGLWNVACWNEQAAEEARKEGKVGYVTTSIKLKWSDCDLGLKLLEQARYLDSKYLELELITILREVMDRIETRLKEIEV